MSGRKLEAERQQGEQRRPWSQLENRGEVKPDTSLLLLTLGSTEDHGELF